MLYPGVVSVFGPGVFPSRSGEHGPDDLHVADVDHGVMRLPRRSIDEGLSGPRISIAGCSWIVDPRILWHQKRSLRTDAKFLRHPPWDRSCLSVPRRLSSHSCGGQVCDDLGNEASTLTEGITIMRYLCRRNSSSHAPTKPDGPTSGPVLATERPCLRGSHMSVCTARGRQ